MPTTKFIAMYFTRTREAAEPHLVDCVSGADMAGLLGDHQEEAHAALTETGFYRSGYWDAWTWYCAI